MPTILDILRHRQLQDSVFVSKSEPFAQNFAFINKHASGPAAVYCDSHAKAESLSEREGISRWIVSTPSMDREGDVLIPLGCKEDLTPFTQNPCVDYDHRRAYPLPIGKSIGDGVLPLIVTETSIRAGCKHHAETQFADEVAKLVFKGMLNACSISFVPIVGEKLNKSYGGDKQQVTPRYKFTRWQPTAWSICPVGINPEAVRMELSMGWIKSEEMVKSLAPLAQKAKIMSHGYSFSEDNMTKFEDIVRDDVCAVRFHKSKFATIEDCNKWLVDKGLDKSLFSENGKSYDFQQQASELSDKTCKVDDGVYVVYGKGMIPGMSADQQRRKLSDLLDAKFKNSESMDGRMDGGCYLSEVFDDHVIFRKCGKCYKLGYSVNDGEFALADAAPVEVEEKTFYMPVGDKAMPPFAKKKPKDDDEEDKTKKKKKPFVADEPGPGEPEVGADLDVGDDEGEDEEVEARDEDDMGEDELTDDHEENVADGDSEEDGDMEMGGQKSGTPTHAQQALIDIAKHKLGELEFYKQSLQVHDHDGLKQLMGAELKAVQQSYDNWLANAKKMFPGLNMDQPALDDDEDSDLDETLGDDSPGDVLDESMKSMTKDELDLLALGLATMN